MLHIDFAAVAEDARSLASIFRVRVAIADLEGVTLGAASALDAQIEVAYFPTRVVAATGLTRELLPTAVANEVVSFVCYDSPIAHLSKLGSLKVDELDWVLAIATLHILSSLDLDYWQDWYHIYVRSERVDRVRLNRPARIVWHDRPARKDGIVWPIH